MKKLKLIDYQGQKLNITEIAKLNGVNSQVLANKYREIGNIDEAVEILKEVQIGPRKYVEFFGQKMTINQIAKIYGIRRETLNYVYKLTSDIDEAVSFCINSNCTSEKLCEEKIKIQKNTVCIDKLTNLDKNSFPATSLKDNDHTFLNNSLDSIEIAENNIQNKKLNEEINKAMHKSLSSRERKILRYRFGFSDGCFHTLSDTGKLLGLCGNRISVIENIALKKLRNPKYKHFADYVREN